MKNVSKKVAQLWSDKRATSAIEFSFFASLLALALINVVDVSTYVYQRMEVQNATEMGAQAAFKACDINYLPATKKCSGLNNAVTAAVQSTSLGTKVTLQSGFPSEGYYCLDSSGALQYVGSVSQAKPVDCSAVSMPTLIPHDYIQVKTTFTYQPLFSSVAVTSLLTTPMTSTSWMRMD